MSKDPTLIVLSNDLPDASYGAERLAAAFVHDGRAVLARACSFFSEICRVDGVARP